MQTLIQGWLTRTWLVRDDLGVRGPGFIPPPAPVQGAKRTAPQATVEAPPPPATGTPAPTTIPTRDGVAIEKGKAERPQVAAEAKSKIDQGDLPGAARVVTEQKNSWLGRLGSKVKSGARAVEDTVVGTAKEAKAIVRESGVKVAQVAKVPTDIVRNIAGAVGRGIVGRANELKTSVDALIKVGNREEAVKQLEAYFKPLHQIATSVKQLIAESKPLEALKQFEGFLKESGHESKEFTKVYLQVAALEAQGKFGEAGKLVETYYKNELHKIQQAALSDKTEDSHITQRLNFDPAGKAGTTDTHSLPERQQQALQTFQQAKEVLGDVNNWKKGVLPEGFDFHVFKGTRKTTDNEKPEKGDYLRISNPPPASDYWVQIVETKQEPNPPVPGQKASFSFTVRPSKDPTGKDKNEIAHFYDPSATRTFRVEYNPSGPGGVPEVQVRTDGLGERPNVVHANPTDAAQYYGDAVLLRHGGLQQEVWESLTFNIAQKAAAAHGGQFNIDAARADPNPADVGPAAQTVHDRYVEKAAAFNAGRANRRFT